MSRISALAILPILVLAFQSSAAQSQAITKCVFNHQIPRSTWTLSDSQQFSPDGAIIITGRVLDQHDEQQFRRFRVHLPGQDDALLAFRHNSDGTFLLVVDSASAEFPLNIAVSRPGFLTAWITGLHPQQGSWNLEVRLRHKGKKGDRQLRDEHSAHPFGLTIFELPR